MQVGVSFGETSELLYNIIEKLNNRKIGSRIGLIVAIPRGGCYTAVRLSHQFALSNSDGPEVIFFDPRKSSGKELLKEVTKKIKKCVADGKEVVWVDDIICSGKTLNATQKFMDEHIGSRKGQTFVALYRRKRVKIEKSELKIVYGARVCHNYWFKFFWEAKINAGRYQIPVYNFS